MSDGTVTCPYCDSEWPADLDLRFCGECGNQLGARSPEITDKERRRLTVLFAGLGTADGDADPAVAESLLSELGGIVERYGGYVDTYTGDAVMAVFGAPAAHEDDPLRAVRTGIEMRDHVDTADAGPCSLSVGINTGEVIWSRVAGGDYTVMGDAVNVAQRLKMNADDGTVRVSRAVRRATDTHVQYAQADGIAVDGRDVPVESFVAGGIEPDAARAGPEPAGGRLVGRERELDRLLAASENPDPTAVAVTGSAGIGKTRLLGTFRDRLADRRAEPAVLVGRCSQHADDPLEPFGEILLSRADTGRGDPDAGPRVVRTVLADFEGSDYEQSTRETFAQLLAVSAGLPVPDASVPDQLQQRARRAWTAWLRELARDRPVVLVVEDLHWAGEATQDLLAALSDQLRDAAGEFAESVTLVGSLRPSGTVPAGFERVELPPLTVEDARAVAEAILDGPVGPELPAFLHEQSGGNPYFLTELLGYLHEDDQLVRTDEGYALDAADRGNAAVPETLDGLLVGRIDALDPGAKETLKGASVVGQEFWVDHLDSVLGRDTSEPVETLSARGLVHPRGESTLPDDREYSFEHALLRDAAYELLPKGTRQELHGAVASSLADALGEETNPLAARIAHHFEQAGEYGRAIDWYRQAGDQVKETGAYLEALDRYDQALSLAEEHSVADETFAGVQADRSHTLASIGAFEDAREAAHDGLSVAPEESRETCWLYGWLAFARMDQGEFERAREAAERERELAAAIGARKPEGHAIHTLGEIAVNIGEYDRARGCLEESIEIHRELDAREEVAQSLEGLGIVADARNEYDRAREYFEDALEIYREIGQRDGVASALNGLGLVALHRGKVDRPMGLFEESLAVKREIGNRQGAANTLANLGRVAVDRAEYDRARGYFEESLALQREIGDPQGEATSLAGLGRIARAQGEYDRAEEHVESALEIRREIGDRKHETQSLASLAGLALARGEFAAAHEYAEESLDVARDIGVPSGEATALATLGAVARERGAYDQARDRLTDALDSSQEIDDPNGTASALAELGRVDREQGAFDRARDRLEESLSIRRDLGDRRGVCRLENDLGAVAAARDEYDRAREHLDDALDTARELGIEAEVTSHRRLGTVARLAGDHELAREHLDDALEAHGGDGDRRELPKIHLATACLALARGDHGTARDRAADAREAVAALGATHWVGRCRLLQGRIAAASGSPAAAREHWEAALETFRDVGAPQDALTTLEHLVAQARDRGADDRAREWCRLAADLLADAPSPVRADHDGWVERHGEALGID